MFGRHRRQEGGEDAPIPVDATLEGDIGRVELSVTSYLQNPTEAVRQSLLDALEALDARADQGDAYGSSVIGSAALGYGSKGEVLGETGLESVVDEVPSSELNAQFALVKAAKDEVRGPTPETLAALRAAQTVLAAVRKQGSAGP